MQQSFFDTSGPIGALTLFPPRSEREQAIDEVHLATAIYTTTSVVEGLLDRIDWPNCGGRLLDPSAGDGAFLVCALQRLAPVPGDFEKLDRVRGYEFHAGAVEDARARVAGTLRGLGWERGMAHSAACRVVEQRDFLTEGGADPIDWLVGNPPYLRYARLPDFFKSLYAKTVAKHAIGDLLHAFVDRVSEILTDGGAIAIVTSDRWLFSQSAAELRRRIGARVALDHVARLDVSTSFYRPKIRRAGSLPRIHPVEVVMRRTGNGVLPITEQPISPDGAEDSPWDGPTLDDVATIRLAPWLGPHGIFTVDRDVAERLRPYADLVPVVDTDDVNPVTDQLSAPVRFAIRTQRNQEPAPVIAAHLQSTRHRMPARGQRGPYWVPPESLPAAWPGPALMVPRIARGIRVIELPVGVQAINHNLTVIRKAEGGASLAAIREALLSPHAAEWITRHAPRLENGYLSITTSLLRRLPFKPER